MIEYEVKVLDIDSEAFAKKVTDMGFAPQGELSFRRFLFDTVPPDPNAIVRLRTDGKKSSLTYKSFLKDAIDGVKEIEVEVSDFDTCKQLLETSGLAVSSYQENKRKIFLNPERPDMEITIDSWPGIPPYAEVEGKSVEDVEKTLAELEVDPEKVTSASPKAIYKLYGLDIFGYDVLSFENLPPKLSD